MMDSPKYRYSDTSFMISERLEDYSQILRGIRNGLEEQIDPDNVSPKDLLEDEQLEISESVFKGETTIEPLRRYRINDFDEVRSVYTFDGPIGRIYVGDYSMLRYAMPEKRIPSDFIPMPSQGSNGL